MNQPKQSVTYPGVMNIAELETDVGVPRAQGVVQPRGHKARQRSVCQRIQGGRVVDPDPH